MPNVQKASQLRVAIAKLIEAEINESWSGAGDPNDIDIIHEELLEARAVVEKLLKSPITICTQNLSMLWVSLGAALGTFFKR